MAKLGRPSLRDEVKMKEVQDLSVACIKSALKSNNIPEQDKIRIAIEIVKKMVVQKNEHTGDFIFKEMKDIIVEGKKYEPKIGS